MVERFLGKDVPLRFTKPKPKSFVSFAASCPSIPAKSSDCVVLTFCCGCAWLFVQWQSFLGSR